ncbi:PQQ-binding-like beta-propeller repeat protein [Actinoplanes sp. DH11]|uniref:outer membrane protein assembly factor BamB family protein n=1 Tax=Actinoplanes sp. DH11 TaxID=2857011 RepID=UPI001E322A91|nr:PQQ-binding-like beta-propeller repeat protein [Actinoplanes sp. DH11]
MPADLDEMFAGLARTADVVPVTGPAVARRNGDRRRRGRYAVGAAAAAVLLVLAGAGVATRRHDPPRPVLPATTVRGLTPIGTPLRVHGPAGENMFSAIAVRGDRVTLASGDLNGGGLKVIGVDGRTGAQVWDAGTTASFETNGPIAVPGAVLVADGPRLRVLDPGTGAELWETTDPANGDVVVGDGVLARVTVDGLTEAFALSTGRKLWSAPASGNDRPRHSTGFLDEGNVRNVHVSDDRLAQITLGGRVLVRDLRTGKIRTSVATTVRPRMMTDFSASGDLALIGDRSGYTDKPSRLVGADLTAGTTKVLHAIETGTLGVSAPCGPQRVCLASNDGTTADGNLNPATLKMIDTATGRVLWTVTPADAVFDISTRAGRVFAGRGLGSGVLYSADGRDLARVDGAFLGRTQGWIDDENVLAMAQTGTGRSLIAISAADGRQTTLGTLSDVVGGCAWTSEILACRDGVELKLWRFER